MRATGWLLLAMTVVMVLAEDGLGRFSDLGSGVNALGIIAGLLATTAMLLMLLLSARVPLVDRALGQPLATSLHSKFGDYVVIGLGLHALLVLVGYAIMDNLAFFDEFGLLWGESDFVLGVVGIGLLVAVVVSSIVAVRKRLPYEVWHVIHLISYAAVGVAIPHMFSMSGLLANGSWQRLYWIGLLVATGLCLLVFRFLRPLWSSLRHRLKVVAVEDLGAGVFSIELAGHAVDRLGVMAGQYLHWRFLARGLWWHQHPFSVSAVPKDGRLRITVRELGRGTAALRHVPLGTAVAIEGPYGTFTDDARVTDSVTLVGAGAGIAPLRAILEQAANRVRYRHPAGLPSRGGRAGRRVAELYRRRGQTGFTAGTSGARSLGAGASGRSYPRRPGAEPVHERPVCVRPRRLHQQRSCRCRRGRRPRMPGTHRSVQLRRLNSSRQTLAPLVPTCSEQATQTWHSAAVGPMAGLVQAWHPRLHEGAQVPPFPTSGFRGRVGTAHPQRASKESSSEEAINDPANVVAETRGRLPGCTR